MNKENNVPFGGEKRSITPNMSCPKCGAEYPDCLAVCDYCDDDTLYGIDENGSRITR
jgi:hypothetical protein